MEITARQICGSTWCIAEGDLMIPCYQLNEQEVILLDSGCLFGGELEDWLDARGWRVRAVLNSHNHWDHVAANAGLQQRFGARIYLPALESACHRTALAFRTGYENGNYQKIESLWREFPYQADEEIPLEDGPLEVCGAVFQVIHTPGHSIDHVAYRTPDQVLYVGDALLSPVLLEQLKLSYALNYEVDLTSKEKLRGTACAACILAHGSVEHSLDKLIDANAAYVRGRAELVWRMVERPMSMEEIIRAVWKQLDLHAHPRYYRTLEIGNMIRGLVQLLCSEGRLEGSFEAGVDVYCRGNSGSREEKNPWNGNW